MTTTYTNDGQQRVLRVLDGLFGHEVMGLAPGEVARQAGISPALATRDLANLAEAGMAERIEETGRWRISAHLAQRAIATMHALQKNFRKAEELNNRYTTQPR